MSIFLFTSGITMAVVLLQTGDALPNIHCNKGQGVPCKSLTCFNGGTCDTSPEGITSCICVEGFFGKECKIDCRTLGYTYIYQVKSCLKFNDILENKYAAQSRCAAENASLVVLDTYEKEMIVKNFTRELTGATKIHLWIGATWLSGMNTASQWQWANGQLLQNTYQKWGNMEPWTYSGTCAIVRWPFYSENEDDFFWQAADCQSTRRSICEKQ